MEIVEDLEFRKVLLKKIEDREFKERTGVHCSDLIFCLNKQALRRLEPQEAKDHDLLLYSLGWATQRWLTGQEQDEPEREVDGIIVTLDAMVPMEGVILDPGHFWSAPWELKCTFQSYTRPIEDSLHWIRQIMAQCYVTGTTTAYLSRLEIMGNWKWVYRPSKPEKIAELVAQFGENWDEHPTLHTYRLEFTGGEVATNWKWLRERRELFLDVLNGKVAPKALALASGMSFECEYCIYKERCNK